MQSQSQLHNKSRKLMRRYIIRCSVCRKPARKAYEDAIYCSDKCKMVAYRKRVAEREAAELAEMQRRHREAQARAQAEAEQKRRAAAAEADRLRQEKLNKERQQAEAERRALRQEEADRAWAKRQELLNKVAPACPKCAGRTWEIYLKSSALFGLRRGMTCTKCGTRIEPTFEPGPCPRCAGHDYHYTLKPDGSLTCSAFEHVRTFEEWTKPKEQKPRYWTPSQS